MQPERQHGVLDKLEAALLDREAEETRGTPRPDDKRLRRSSAAHA